MNSQDKIKILVCVFIMCLLTLFLGWTIGVRMYYEEPLACEDLTRNLIPFKHCLQEGGGCKKDNQFFIDYYDIQWEIEEKCINGLSSVQESHY